MSGMDTRILNPIGWISLVFVQSGEELTVYLEVFSVV